MSTKQSKNTFLQHLHEVFRTFGPIESRRMFGGYGIYHQGLIIGIAVGESLYLKADDMSVPDFKTAGSVPFEYEKNGVVTKISYYSLPAEAFDDSEVARKWALLAFDASLRSNSGKKAKARRPGG
jgi:DNA transformation protein